MKIREMSAREAWEYFHDLGQRGLIAEDGDSTAGWVGFNSDEHGLYVHSMFCADEGHACAALVQAMIQLARDLGLSRLRYIVDGDNPHFLRLVERGRASIQSYVVALPVEPSAGGKELSGDQNKRTEEQSIVKRI